MMISQCVCVSLCVCACVCVCVRVCVCLCVYLTSAVVYFLLGRNLFSSVVQIRLFYHSNSLSYIFHDDHIKV